MSSYTTNGGFQGWMYNGGVWAPYGSGDPGPEPTWVPGGAGDPAPNAAEAPQGWDTTAPPPPPATNNPPPPVPPGPAAGAGGSPGAAYGSIASMLPGYGLSQNLQGIGAPGFDTQPLIGGGSWAGTTWNPPPAPPALPPAPPPTGGGGDGGGTGQTVLPGQVWGYTWVPESGQTPGHYKPALGGTAGMPFGVGDPGYDAFKMEMIGAQADYIYQSQGGNYESIVNDLMAGDKWLTATQQPITGGGVGTPVPGSGQFGITKAVPYQTSPYSQTYGGKPPPFGNIHEQIGASMQGVPPAYPGFAWAGPQAMAQAQPSATGVPPGGWTQMLGYTPGAPSNYGFIGHRPNPYGITGLPLGPNPTIGG